MIQDGVLNRKGGNRVGLQIITGLKNETRKKSLIYKQERARVLVLNLVPKKYGSGIQNPLPKQKKKLK